MTHECEYINYINIVLGSGIVVNGIMYMNTITAARGEQSDFIMFTTAYVFFLSVGNYEV